MPYNAIPPRTEEVTKLILDAAFKVHTALGPGLLELSTKHVYLMS